MTTMLKPTEEDPFGEVPPPAPKAPKAPTRRPGRKPITKERARVRAIRERRVPFADQSPPPERSAEGPVILEDGQAFVHAGPSEIEMKVKILWDEYEERQRASTAPKTLKYRCLAPKPDGAICGAIVEAGNHEERIRTGEIVRCPHGPDDREAGVFFDRERYPRYHHELTPMEPIY